MPPTPPTDPAKEAADLLNLPTAPIFVGKGRPFLQAQDTTVSCHHRHEGRVRAVRGGNRFSACQRGIGDLGMAWK
jgi:hypothetical protein